ncbi:MAG: S8 family peptidase [Gemmatimonadales bacterium]|nr:S8 family peptidase [Gemmatimonadales bacterium]
MHRFRVLLAQGALLLVAAAPALGQNGVAKLDPLLRPFRDADVVARANGVTRVEDVAAAVGLPSANQIVLTRGPGRVEMFVDAFISLTDSIPGLIEAVGGEVRVLAGSLIGARLPLSALAGLEGDPRVRYIQAAHYVRLRNDLAMVDIRANLVRSVSGTTFTGATGSNVIVGILDTGIDFRHGDFRNPDGTSRLLYLWDQTVSGTPPGVIGGQSFSRGNECNAALINANGCSQQDTFGHGTHVAGIAAGNGAATGAGQPAYQYTGVAPNANLIVVKGGNGSFSTLNIIEGIQYIFKRATTLGRPAVVNLSLGGQFGPHDGTMAEEQAIDSLSGPGKIVVISAGNEGSNQNNIGTGSNTPFLIHAARTLNTGDTAQFTVVVPSYSGATGASNDFVLLTMWYDARDTVTVTVTRPNGTSFSRRTGDAAAATDDAQGRIFIDNASSGLAPQNLDRQVEIEFFDAVATQTPAPGTWRVTVQMNRRLGNGRFDTWLYASQLGATFLEAQIVGGGDNGNIVGSPGNASRAITVAAHTTRLSWNSQGGNNVAFTVRSTLGDLATFSSSGPSRPVRDAVARQKPDISAPGTAIFSSLSINTTPAPNPLLVGTDGVHTIAGGTSMSAPMVTGSTALLLERNPGLTPELVRAILAGSARSDGFTAVAYNTASGSPVGAPLPNASWGYGKLDVQMALGATPANLTATAGPSNGSLGGPFVLPRSIIPSLQVRLSGSQTDAFTLTGIRLRSTGTGNDATGVIGVSLYADVDSTGTVGGSEVLLGTVAVPTNDGEAVFTGLSLNLPVSANVYLLAAYALNGTPTNGQTFQLNLEAAANITAQKVSDASDVTFSGIAISGGVVRAQAIGTVAASSGGALVSSVATTGQPNVVLLRLNATPDASEGFSLRRFVGTIGGTATPAASLQNLRLVRDANGNGVFDTGDSSEATIASTVTGATVAASFTPSGDPRASAATTKNWLVVADFPITATVGGTIDFRTDSLSGRGLVTDSAIVTTGLPVTGSSLNIIQSTLAYGGPVLDTAAVLRTATALALAHVRFVVQGESTIVDSLILRTTGNLAANSLTNMRLVADLDSNGVAGSGEPVLATSLNISGGVVRVLPGNGGILPPGDRWWVVLGDGADNATWGQAIQFRLDSADVYARGKNSGTRPVKLGPVSFSFRRFTIGGQAALAVAPGPSPPTARLQVGALAALQLTIGATSLEGARVDSLRVSATSGNSLSALVQQLALYRDSAGTGMVPSGPPLATVNNPFAAGASATFKGLNHNVAAGGSQTLLAVLTLTDRLRQGDTLGLTPATVYATGLLSTLPATVSLAGSSTLGSATILAAGEAFIFSENPVRNGQVIFSYDQIPRSVAIYSFSGLRVRLLEQLPPNRYVWDVRGESPGLPNGMYLVVIDTGTGILRRRLMILSPSR